MFLLIEEVSVRRWLPALVCLPWLAAASVAETPQGFSARFAAEARRERPGLTAFSPERGKQFFTSSHGSDWSCASCHGADPRRVGEHATTGKRIEPLAPAANAERFTQPDKVAKWFKRNCRDVLARECTALEKGDVLAWLMALEK